MHHKLDTFYVIGIAVRTTNENQQAAQDIPVLWHKFMTEGIMDQIRIRSIMRSIVFIQIMRKIIQSLILQS